MTRTRLCENCAFWDAGGKDLPSGRGWCRVKSPARLCGDWPNTRPKDWCGEWGPVPDDAGESVQTESRFEDLDALARRLEDEAFPKRNREEFP